MKYPNETLFELGTAPKILNTLSIGTRYLRPNTSQHEGELGIICMYTPPKTKMTMENRPFEDLFPIQNGDFPMSC